MMPIPTLAFRILLVDDEQYNLVLLQHILKHDYDLMTARDGHEALELASREIPDLIISDVMMPRMDGHELCKKLKADPKTADIPLIFVTAVTGEDDEGVGFDLGAVDYISKPIKARVVKARVATHLALAHQQKASREEVRKRTEQLHMSTLEILLSLMRAARLKDNETANHTLRVGLISYVIAGHLDYDYRKAFRIFLAAPLHDIGKLGVRDDVLYYKGDLRENPELWEHMKAHTEHGAEIIGKSVFDENLAMAYNIARYHHEKVDGSGYPVGLNGDQIPQEAMIVAVADMIDAMLDPSRPYRNEPLSEEKIRDIFARDRGSKLPGDVIDAALDNWETIMTIERVFPNEQSVPFEGYSRLSPEEFGNVVREIIEKGAIPANQ